MEREFGVSIRGAHMVVHEGVVIGHVWFNTNSDPKYPWIATKGQGDRQGMFSSKEMAHRYLIVGYANEEFERKKRLEEANVRRLPAEDEQRANGE